jgi:septal ring factor EnvC (AmiA/AmiB activator)
MARLRAEIERLTRENNQLKDELAAKQRELDQFKARLNDGDSRYNQME